MKYNKSLLYVSTIVLTIGSVDAQQELAQAVEACDSTQVIHLLQERTKPLEQQEKVQLLEIAQRKIALYKDKKGTFNDFWGWAALCVGASSLYLGITQLPTPEPEEVCNEYASKPRSGEHGSFVKKLFAQQVRVQWSKNDIAVICIYNELVPIIHKWCKILFGVAASVCGIYRLRKRVQQPAQKYNNALAIENLLSKS